MGGSFRRWSLFSALLLLPAAFLPAAEPLAAVTVVAPRDGAVLGAATVTLAGTVDGSGGGR